MGQTAQRIGRTLFRNNAKGTCFLISVSSMPRYQSAIIGAVKRTKNIHIIVPIEQFVNQKKDSFVNQSVSASNYIQTYDMGM
ncbi:MAG: hypothetical protein WCJ01_06085 [Ignavibacteria bacterium]